MPRFNRSCSLFLILFALTLIAGCSPQAEPVNASPMVAENAERSESRGDEVTESDALVQYSLITALAAGDYDNGLPLRRFLEGGDFGIGTFDRLDGELVLLDGEIYQAMSDGRVRPADLDGGTPFASATFFDEDGRIEKLSAATLEDLDEQLDRKLPRRNSPYALRIDGAFRELTLRSVPAQSPPFRPLVEVVKEQTTKEYRDVQGTLVGLRYPKWIGTLNVSGYHWHFLSDDRKTGGHVLGCQFDDALLCYDECTSIVLQIPQSEAFENFDNQSVGQREIDVIERQRTDK